MKRYLLSIAFGLLGTFVIGQNTITIKTESVGQASFPLFEGKKAAPLFYDSSDFEVVKEVVNLFAEDVKSVTGVKPKVHSKGNINAKHAIIAGTLGHSQLIDNLIASGKLNADPIRGGWEQFLIKTLDQPLPGVEKALVIAGSDRRGTAYGLFTLSESLGVSPWTWWADVPVKKQKALFVPATDFASKTPSVKYRGIFINDEGWGITPWAGKTYDTDLKDIGPKTYAKVFELLLRLKANMLAPAMHPSSGAFNKYPENKVVADKYGIIMTSSHCEPLLFNNTTEWDKPTMGEWNYATNKDGIMKILDKRVSENAPYENVYTIAMRGIHDAGMVGIPKERQGEMLEIVMKDQRSLLSKYIDKPLEEIPQIFVPYKEVLNIYEEGLDVPEDITIVWPDDNFGYIKRLSNASERKRKGGAGVYYHLSYLGEPHDYLWLNTTPPALMYEELRKAYDTGAQRYWLLNVGDIKPGELGIQLFADMAWDMDRFSYENINDFQVRFLTRIFGGEYEAELKDIMSTYYRLAFQRKPEAMGWGWEWNKADQREIVHDTDFSFLNYNEAENRLAEYDRIQHKAKQIWEGLDAAYKPAFYELLYYSVAGASLMNKKMLTAQKNRWYANQRRAATNKMAERTQAYQDSIQIITDHYNRQLNGKWNHMMEVPPGWVATYQNLPPVTTIPVPEKAEMGLFVPGSNPEYGCSNVYTLPCFNPYSKKKYAIEIYNKGRLPFDWEATTAQSWIKLSQTKGRVEYEDRLEVSIDWAQAPIGERISGEIRLAGAGKEENVFVSLFNPASPRPEELKGMYFEENGYVSMDPSNFQRKNANEGSEIQVIEGLGYENSCLQLGTVTSTSRGSVEYDFYTFNSGPALLHIFALPLFALDTNSETKYGVMLDDGLMKRPETASREYSNSWKENVIRNNAIYTTTVVIDKPGKHTLKVFTDNPGVIIQKIIIDTGGLKKSYLGPEITTVRNQ